MCGLSSVSRRWASDSILHCFDIVNTASLKMTDPHYQDIPASAIPEVTEDDGTRVRIICGEFWG